VSDGITVPAPYVGMDDATLTVDTDDGERYRMTLTRADGHVIADADGFRPGAGFDFGAHRPGMTAGTFGAFLAHALESTETGEDDPRRDWDIIADDASDWTDALALMEETESSPNRHDS
jgi:hypothetical protein